MDVRLDRFVAWWAKQDFWRYLWVPVLVSIGMSEAIVAGMSVLLLGRIDDGYMLTGLVASGLVSLAVSAALFFLANRVDRRLQQEFSLRQKIIDSIPGAFCLFDASGRFLMWNRNLETIVGMRADELACAHALDLFEEADRPRMELSIQEAFETGTSAAEATLCARDGRCTPFRFNGFRFNFGGKPALLGIGIDITERKRAEAALLETKDRLAMALEASSLSIWDFDIKSGIVYLDKYWAEMIGALPGVTTAPVADLLGLVHADDRQRIVDAALRLFKGDGEMFQEDFRCKSAAGEWKWIRCSGEIAERDAAGRAVRAVGTNLDNTERKAAEERIHQLAYYDPLTGLPNRTLLMDRLHQALSQAKRFRRSLAILFLDLDDFKRTNDTLGHQAGDELLVQVARRLIACVRTGDTVSRQGGDEFVIVLAEIGHPEDASRVAEKVIGAMEAPFCVAERELSVTVSVGICVYPVDGADDVHELMKKADIAMYAAKRGGCNRYEFYAAEAAAGS